MKAQLTLLAELQALDSKLRGMEAGRDSVFAKQRVLQAEVEKLRSEFKASSTKVEELEREKRAKDGELMGERDKLKKWESRLEDMRNTREFAALGREVEGLKRAITDLTERTQVLGTETKEHTEKMRAVEARLTESEKALAAEKEGARGTLNDQEKTITDQKAARARIAGQLPANVMKRYEQILQKRAGLAVVPARDGHCKGCNMALPPQLYIKVQRAETLEVCPACNRILYFPDNLAGAAQNP